MEEKFDVVIIGAGIAGLTSAALLSKSGLKVCVLERHYLIGGYIQGFERKGFVFDTAIHWLNQCGKDGTVSKLFEYIDPDFPRPQTMTVIKRHLTDNHEFVLTNQPEELKKQLTETFPEDKKGIEKFFGHAKKIAKISLKFPSLFRSTETMGKLERLRFQLKRMAIGMPMIKHIFYSGERGMEKGLSKYFSNPELKQLFSAERDMLSCLFPIAWAYNNDFQNPPIGGSQNFARWMNDQIELSNGSEIKLSADVQNIVIEDDLFRGVEYIKRGKKYRVDGKYLIAACDVSKLYSNMLPAAKVNDEIIDKLKTSEMYSSSVTIHLALDCPVEELGFGHELIFLSKDGYTREEYSSGDPHISAISILAPTARDKTMTEDGKGVLTLYVPAWMDYENNWRAELNEKGEYVRGNAYKEFKNQYAEIIISRVEERFCKDLRKHILFTEIATPITYYRYTHNRGGSMMGTRPGKINMQNKIAHYKTQYKNVIIGGQWAELGGGIPIATKAAYNASLIVLKELNPSEFKKLIKVMN